MTDTYIGIKDWVDGYVVDKKIQILKTLIKEGYDIRKLDVKILDNEVLKNYICQAAGDSYAAKKGIESMKNLPADEFIRMRSVDISKDYEDMENLQQSIAMIQDSFIIFLKNAGKRRNLDSILANPLLQLDLQKSNLTLEEFKLVLEKCELTKYTNIVNEFTTQLQKWFNSYQKLKQKFSNIHNPDKNIEKKLEKNEAYYIVYKKLEEKIRNKIVEKTKECLEKSDIYDNVVVRNIAHDLKIVPTMEEIIKMQPNELSKYKLFLSSVFLLNKFENNELPENVIKLISPKNLIERFLQHHDNPEKKEHAINCIKRIQPNQIIELFKENTINIDELILAFRKMIEIGINRNKILNCIKNALPNNNKSNVDIYITPIDIFKLVEAGLLKETMLMDAYHTQEIQKQKEPENDYNNLNYDMIPFDKIKNF